jgi:ABC-type multidrug transport system permease subunit
MLNKIAGAIALLMIVMFLGEYATTINAVPLWIIIVSVLAMVAADYLLSLKSKDDE